MTASTTTQIGTQMFTVREHTRTEADLARTFERLKAIGYDAVQVSAIGPIETAAVGRLLREHGLTCAATHTNLELMEDVQKCVDYHGELGCQYTAVGGFFVPADATVQSFIDWANRYNDIAASLKPHQIYCGYHNHSHEFATFEGRRMYDVLLETFSDDVWLEVDTYWVQHGGADPAAWLSKLAGRVPCIHVKDMSVTAEREPVMCEVGSGNLNWPAILAAARTAGVQWYLVERDHGELDPFESLQVSLENLRAMGLR